MMVEKMNRIPTWRIQLGAAEDRMRSSTFEWGRYDCAQAVVQVLEAITGEDLSGRWAYTSQREALDLSGADLLAFAEREFADLGLRKVDPYFAQSSDVAIADTAGDGVLAFAFIGTGGTALAVSAKGLVNVPLERVRVAWRVAPCHKQE